MYGRVHTILRAMQRVADDSVLPYLRIQFVLMGNFVII